ncbi:hypothetical protein CH275_15675 [Rhodococcus sp. 06-235-1A]|nr:hypothetical protein CH275_15675 [Rhodococcus sp. 06-235-1A]
MPASMAESRVYVALLPLVRTLRRLEASGMTIVLVVVLLFLALDAFVVAGFAPDTHAEVTQFGDYRF